MAALFVDKHRPSRLNDLELNPSLTRRLQQMVSSASAMPHMLFYGPSGAGKKTRAMAALREIYGSGVDKVKLESKEFKVSSSKKLDITTLSSNYHLELTPSEAGIYDRVIVQELIKEVAATHQLNVTQQKSFKVIILNEVDTLTRNAQHALRRTMEKYIETCRLILLCENISKVIDALRSRCLLIRIPAPSITEVATVLQNISSLENFILPENFALRIAEQTCGNLRKAILVLEAAKVEKYPFNPKQMVRLSDWEVFVDEISRLVLEEQSHERLQLIRGKFYELLQNLIPPQVIIRTLSNSILKRVDEQLKFNIISLAAECDHRMLLGSKPIIHLEAFVAHCMYIYKKWTLELIG